MRSQNHQLLPKSKLSTFMIARSLICLLKFELRKNCAMLFRMVCQQRIILLHLRPMRNFVSPTNLQPLLIYYGHCSGYFYTVSSTRWRYQVLKCNSEFYFLFQTPIPFAFNPLTMQSFIPFIPFCNLPLLSFRVIFQLLVNSFSF